MTYMESRFTYRNRRTSSTDVRSSSWNGELSGVRRYGFRNQIMYGIHEQCVKYGTEPDGYINYMKGANIAGFMKVAHAMMAQGIV